MNKSSKFFLYTFLVLLLLLFVGGYFVLKILGDAFGEKCEEVNSWNIQNYEIKKLSCIGWAGPPYYPHYLYKNGEEIARSTRIIDSCNVTFRSKKDLVLLFNSCTKEIKEVRPSKTNLIIPNIDSIIMTRVFTDSSKVLSKRAIKFFVNKWNTSPVYDYRNNKKPFYSGPSYLFRVYTKTDIRVFETDDFIIKDTGNNWTYSFLDEGEDFKTKKFGEMWNEFK